MEEMQAILRYRQLWIRPIRVCALWWMYVTYVCHERSGLVRSQVTRAKLLLFTSPPYKFPARPPLLPSSFHVSTTLYNLPLSTKSWIAVWKWWFPLYELFLGMEFLLALLSRAATVLEDGALLMIITFNTAPFRQNVGFSAE